MEVSINMLCLTRYLYNYYHLLVMVHKVKVEIMSKIICFQTYNTVQPLIGTVLICILLTIWILDILPILLHSNGSCHNLTNLKKRQGYNFYEREHGAEWLEVHHAKMNLKMLFMLVIRLYYRFTRQFSLMISSIESKHEVTILGGLNEFIVKFYGPSGSKYIKY